MIGMIISVRAPNSGIHEGLEVIYILYFVRTCQTNKWLEESGQRLLSLGIYCCSAAVIVTDVTHDEEKGWKWVQPRK